MNLYALHTLAAVGFFWLQLDSSGVSFHLGLIAIPDRSFIIRTIMKFSQSYSHSISLWIHFHQIRKNFCRLIYFVSEDAELKVQTKSKTVLFLPISPNFSLLPSPKGLSYSHHRHYH